MEIACNAVKGFGKKKKKTQAADKPVMLGGALSRLHPAYNLKMNPTPTILIFFP